EPSRGRRRQHACHHQPSRRGRAQGVRGARRLLHGHGRAVHRPDAARLPRDATGLRARAGVHPSLVPDHRLPARVGRRAARVRTHVRPLRPQAAALRRSRHLRHQCRRRRAHAVPHRCDHLPGLLGDGRGRAEITRPRHGARHVPRRPHGAGDVPRHGHVHRGARLRAGSGFAASGRRSVAGGVLVARGARRRPRPLGHPAARDAAAGASPRRHSSRARDGPRRGAQEPPDRGLRARPHVPVRHHGVLHRQRPDPHRGGVRPGRGLPDHLRCAGVHARRRQPGERCGRAALRLRPPRAVQRAPPARGGRHPGRRGHLHRRPAAAVGLLRAGGAPAARRVDADAQRQHGGHGAAPARCRHGRSRARHRVHRRRRTHRLPGRLRLRRVDQALRLRRAAAGHRGRHQRAGAGRSCTRAGGLDHPGHRV
ncbi:MAG: hypothetical protein AVDCRST_MAG50-944, partial [uncultured Acidimicrobiales bacterium]